MLPMEEGSSESSLDEEEVGYAATRIRSISVQTDDGGRAHTLILEEYEELHNDDRMFEARHFALGNLAAKLAHWRLEGHWTMQCVSLFAGGFLTHLYAYSGPRVGGDLAQATLITLCGHLAPPLTAPFAFGAFTGVLSPKLAPAYHWLALLLLVGCILWLLVSHFKVFVGFGGRVGFTAFCSCYLVQAVVLMPVGAVEYRAVNLLADMLLDGAKVSSVRVAYEQRVWQKDVISVLAPVFGAVTANFLRSCGASLENPITGATSGSLTAFLVLSVSGWSFAPVAMNGFAVGSFVGMASFEYLPTTMDAWDEEDKSLFYDKTFPHRQIPSIDGPGATATGLAQPMWVPARRLHRGQWRLFDGIDGRLQMGRGAFVCFNPRTFLASERIRAGAPYIGTVDISSSGPKRVLFTN
ncbi:CAPN15 [Symbiodinium necroappetens]|uniref:CAPN15 protein n=1 Tax=Symbiodinium necroappetens TaxID=1628268 RepID=A0A812KGN9_9DINO|nr:CAPN15 [Symbiodinium necroappetens]